MRDHFVQHHKGAAFLLVSFLVMTGCFGLMGCGRHYVTFMDHEDDFLQCSHPNPYLSDDEKRSK
jgi:hypothetical protein